MLTKLLTGVGAHFDAHKRRTKWQFFWRIFLEGLVVPILTVGVLKLFFQLPPRTDLRHLGPAGHFFLAVVIAPLIETLLGQALPVMIARYFGLGFWGQLISSVVPFAALHAPSGISTLIGAGIVGGFYLAFTYVRWREASFKTAFWMTCAMHAVHNAVLVGLILIARHPK